MKIFLTASSWTDFRTRLRLISHHLKASLKELGTIPYLANELGNLNSPGLKLLQSRVQGLHPLLPNSERFRYSILIPIYHPKPQFLRTAIQSAINQSAPYFEILLGLDGDQNPDVMKVINQLASAHPSKIRVIPCDRKTSGGGISRTTNRLAEAATGNFLLLMDHDDWIAPDLLYRYEQCLRLHQDPENLILYCDEYKINTKDEAILYSHTNKPEHPIFPYIFINYICHCLLVPKKAWTSVGGLRPQCDGAQDFDLCLRLDAKNFYFQLVPFFLYAWRVHEQSTAFSVNIKDYATPAGIIALRDYCAEKNLDWEITRGYMNTTYRGQPRLPSGNQTLKPIHVIIPYRDQKEMTLRAVRSALAQVRVNVKITAVDNQSQDRSIAQEIERLGGEVIRVEEAFNYSRLNNAAVRLSRFASSVDSILFLNNDVELESDALEEMARWIDQPRIGLVGAKLFYPNGTLQHGGVRLNLEKHGGRTMRWEHIDARAPTDRLGFSQIMGVCDAVTAACVLVKRNLFHQVGGFDEIWYPIAFSDTDLAVKMRRAGYYSFYTPYARGLHDESISRGPGAFQAADCSYWMLRATTDRAHPVERLPHHFFLNRES